MLIKRTLGKLAGNVYENSRGFLGIPYAEPPVGMLRWRPTVRKRYGCSVCFFFFNTVPTSPWNGTLSVKEYKDGCPQNCDLPPGTCPNTTSEDCLFLNVRVCVGMAVVNVGLGVDTQSGEDY